MQIKWTLFIHLLAVFKAVLYIHPFSMEPSSAAVRPTHLILHFGLVNSPYNWYHTILTSALIFSQCPPQTEPELPWLPSWHLWGFISKLETKRPCEHFYQAFQWTLHSFYLFFYFFKFHFIFKLYNIVLVLPNSFLSCLREKVLSF